MAVAGLLTIPQELRDHIYSYCGSSIAITSMSPGPRLILGNAPNVSLLRVSCQINDEYAKAWPKTLGVLTIKIGEAQNRLRAGLVLDFDSLSFHPTFPANLVLRQVKECTIKVHTDTIEKFLDYQKVAEYREALRTSRRNNTPLPPGLLTPAQRQGDVYGQILRKLAHLVLSTCRCNIAISLIEPLEEEVAHHEFKPRVLKRLLESNPALPFTRSVTFIHQLPVYCDLSFWEPASPDATGKHTKQAFSDNGGGVTAVTRCDGGTYTSYCSTETTDWCIRLLTAKQVKAGHEAEFVLGHSGFEVVGIEVDDDRGSSVWKEVVGRSQWQGVRNRVMAYVGLEDAEDAENEWEGEEDYWSEESAIEGLGVGDSEMEDSEGEDAES